jgi:hypothetical protein
MSHDAEEVLRDKPKNNSFSIQADESTDFTNKSYVVAFIRFVSDGEIQENFFCSKELPKTSKGYDMFNVLSSYLETKGPSLEKCVGICTDGIPLVVGSIRGFASLVKKKKKILTSQHIALVTERCWFKNSCR